MKPQLTRLAIAVAVLAVCASGTASAQENGVPPSDTAAATPAPAPAPPWSEPQIEQMLAPIALYPDALVSQILVASTYPLEVVQADRWLADGDHAGLSGDQLLAALDQQNWDPSVKSLVAFPQILHMMDGNLTWTENLGNAFLANQAGVMDAVQTLRHRAELAGKLASTPQQAVTTQDNDISIAPADPNYVYVPVYDPALAYGAWPYYGYPPYYFPGYFGGYALGGFGFGWFGVSVGFPFWGWGVPDWGHHRIGINPGPWGGLNGHVPPPGGFWTHNPIHRAGVPYRDAGTRARFGAANGNPANYRALRGFAPAPQVNGRPAPIAPNFSGTNRPAVAPGQNRAPANVPRAATPSQSYSAPRTPPSFESYGRGADVRVQQERGETSRASSSHAGFSGGSHGGSHGSGGHR